VRQRAPPPARARRRHPRAFAYHRPMHLSRRLSLSLCVGLLLPACKDSDAGETSSASTTNATTESPSSTSTGTTVTPTTAVDDTSTGEPPKDSCTAVTSEAECKTKDMCTWKGVVQYTHGTQGCLGNIVNFCVSRDPTGAPSGWYREVDGDAQVVEFGYTPDDLPPAWMPCTCDGPLACLCPSIAPDCPERLDAFCGAIGNPLACGQTTTHGDLTCDWFSLSPEGPADDKCADSAEVSVCLPATNVGAKTCTPPTYTFQPCTTWPQDLFWREVNGIIEVITVCGPKPIGWTQCEADDTVDQPDECKCRCL